MIPKILPAVIVLVCFSVGIAVGALNHHLSQGAFIGVGVGFLAGLIVFLITRKRPDA
jgi:hypothetical protein